MIVRCSTPVILLLYAVAVAWHSLHPIMSVLSGHWNHPLTPFVDENSIDASFYRAPAFDRRKNLSFSIQGKSLCDALTRQRISFASNIRCVSLSASMNEPAKRSSIDVARIAPANAPVNPQNEALVLIAPHHTMASEFALLPAFVQHLAERPWLAKTVFVVTPSEANGSVSLALETFLKLQLEDSTNLPAEYRGSVLRQLLVLSSQPSSSASRSKVLLAPTGNSGIMPNMDLYSVAYRVFSISNKFIIQAYPDHVLQKAENWKNWLASTSNGRLQFTTKKSNVTRWWNSLWNWIFWEIHLATRVEASPHAMALECGIDSMTMELLPSTKSDTVAFLKSVEMIIHSMSNAHERLHHNTALFALPQAHGNAYLKHEEFLIPNLLLLIPLIIRAVTLLFFSTTDEGSFEVLETGQTLCAVSLATFAVSSSLEIIQTKIASTSIVTTQQWVVAGHYVILGIWIVLVKGTSAKSKQYTKSLQIGACLMILFLHLPIAFGHVALAFPSALFLAPWASVWTLKTSPPLTCISAIFQWTTRVLILLILLICGPYILVPRIFAHFTTYVKYVYTPCHILLVIVWASSL